MANLRASEAWLHDAGAAAAISIFGVAIITLSWTSAAVAATTPTVPLVVARVVSASAITKTRELTTTGTEVGLACVALSQQKRTLTSTAITSIHKVASARRLWCWCAASIEAAETGISQPDLVVSVDVTRCIQIERFISHRIILPDASEKRRLTDIAC
jgi:hypothetical protein